MDTQIDKIIYDALEEDIPTIDITSDNLLTDQQCEGVFVAEEDGVLSGVKVMQRVFQILDDEIYIKVINGDGTYVEKGDIIAIISGRLGSVLKGERLALNFMKRMSGIASITRKYVNKLDNKFTKIVDTRKTTPNFRILEKQAVTDGGGINHRLNLSCHAVITENHINAVGDIATAVDMIKSKIDQSIKIEVVVKNFNQFLEAIHTKCDIIMLADMSNEEIRKCVHHNSDKLLQACGNMTIDRIKSVADTGIDFISVDALTQTYNTFEISLKYNK